MVSKKILLDFEEYRRLLSYEKKYGELKAQMREQLPEQKGEGREQDLEKTVLTNENQGDSKPQEILPPITTPAEIVDIGKSENPSSVEHTVGGKIPEHSVSEKMPKTAEEPLPEKWWYIGKPSYKH